MKDEAPFLRLQFLICRPAGCSVCVHLWGSEVMSPVGPLPFRAPPPVACHHDWLVKRSCPVLPGSCDPLMAWLFKHVSGSPNDQVSARYQCLYQNIGPSFSPDLLACRIRSECSLTVTLFSAAPSSSTPSGIWFFHQQSAEQSGG